MKQWYIMERHNPQLGVYYVAKGQMPKAEAKQYERPIYGHNYMLAFPTKEAYSAKIAELRNSGQAI